MGAKTELKKEDFKQILSNYHLGKYQNHKDFDFGWCQTTLLLETTRGKYVLKRYENNSEADIFFQVNLLNYLKTKNYPVPYVIKDNSGKYIGLYNKKPFILLEYIKGNHCKDPYSSPQKEILAKVIEIISQLHLLTANRKKKDFGITERFNTDYWLKKFKKHPNRSKNNSRESWLRNELDNLISERGLPRGIVHGDMNYSNFLFERNEIVAVLDFDFSFYSPFIYDIANLIFYWAWPPKKDIDFDRVRFIIREYSKHRELSIIEKEDLHRYLKLVVLIDICHSNDEDFDKLKKQLDYLKSIGKKVFNNKIFSKSNNDSGRE